MPTESTRKQQQNLRHKRRQDRWAKRRGQKTEKNDTPPLATRSAAVVRPPASRLANPPPTAATATVLTKSVIVQNPSTSQSKPVMVKSPVVQVGPCFFTRPSVESLTLKEWLGWRPEDVNSITAKLLQVESKPSRNGTATVGHVTIASVKFLTEEKGLTETELSLLARMLIRLDLEFAEPDGSPFSHCREHDNWDEKKWEAALAKLVKKLVVPSLAEIDQYGQTQRRTLPTPPKPEPPTQRQPASLFERLTGNTPPPSPKFTPPPSPRPTSVPTSAPAKPAPPTTVTATKSTAIPTKQDVPIVDDTVVELAMPKLYDDAGSALVEPLTVANMAPNPLQPRTFFNPQSLEALGADLKVRQLLPIFVAPVDNFKRWIQFVSPEEYEAARTAAFYEAISGGEPRLIFRHGELDGVEVVIVDGERRWRAAQLAGITELKVIIVDITTADQLFLVSFFSNEHREQLPPMDEAYSFKRMISRKIITVARLAERLNRSTPHIYQRLALLKLCPEVQALMSPDLPVEKRLGPYAGYQLSSLEDPAMQLKFALEIITKKIGGREIGPYVRLRASQEGAPRQSRGFTPRRDYENLVNFLHQLGVKIELFTEMPVPQLKAIFQYRDPQQLQQVIKELQGDIGGLNNLLTLLRQFIGGQKA